jgi:hypothetical protein
MNAFQIILIFVISLLGYPLGLVLADLTREELKSGRIFFKIIILLTFISIIVSLLFLKGTNLIAFIAIMIFIFLVALASLVRSKKLKLKK